MSYQEYTNKDAVENYLVRDIDDAYDLPLEEWIRAMSIYIDNSSNRVIAKVPTNDDTKVETYKYDGDGTDSLLISDCTDISEVKVDGVVVTPAKYPANKSYTWKIKLPAGQCFTEGMQNVEVTAIQAMYKTIPDDIKFACTVLVALIFNNQISKERGTTERIGNYQITYTDAQKSDVDTVKAILNSYKRITF